MQYFVQFDVHQPVDMSREELFTIWLEEARAAQGAVDAGAVTNLWKVVGQRSVFRSARGSAAVGPVLPSSGCQENS
ncbi:MAG: muconolactone Delta-isomerase family protein [Mycobacterium sp.]